MNISLHRMIGGVDYLVTIPAGIECGRLGPGDAAFTALQPPGDEVIRVDLRVGEMPDVGASSLLVSSGEYWSILANDALRCLRSGGSAGGRPAVSATCWSLDDSHAALYCDPAMVAEENGRRQIANPGGYPTDQILLMYYLAKQRGLIVHAAGLRAGERTLIFPGVSGAGKSTLARQFQAAGCTELLSDDRIIVRKVKGCWHAYGTPWPGDAGVAVNAHGPLGGIFFPVKGSPIHLVNLSPQAALDRLLPAASILWYEPDLLSHQMESCEALLAEVPAFELTWSPTDPIVDFVEGLVRQL